MTPICGDYEPGDIVQTTRKELATVITWEEYESIHGGPHEPETYVPIQHHRDPNSPGSEMSKRNPKHIYRTMARGLLRVGDRYDYWNTFPEELLA